MIELRHVTKRFGRFTALDDVCLDVAAGEVVALWGPNGAGKSTLVRCLLGLLPFRGAARIDGLDVRRHGKAVRRRVGYLPQEPALFDDLRVAEVSMLFARLKRVGIVEARRMLEATDLAPHARKRVRELSGGMKQRLALGLARLTDPPVLLLDEPTSNLDAAARADLLGEVDGLRRVGKTVLLISHRPEEVRRTADRIVTLEAGRIVRIADADGTDRAEGERSVLVPGDRLDLALSVMRGAGIAARPEAETTRGSREDRPDPPSVVVPPNGRTTTIERSRA